MKDLLLILLIVFTNCQPSLNRSSAELNTGEQNITSFESDDAEMDRAIDKAILHLKNRDIEPDSFYVSGVEKGIDSIKLILFHYNLIKEIDASKESTNDQWVVLPPLSFMPGLYEELIYLIKDDLIISTSE